jgi:hypothetical protein
VSEIPGAVCKDWDGQDQIQTEAQGLRGELLLINPGTSVCFIQLVSVVSSVQHAESVCASLRSPIPKDQLVY